MNTQTQTVQTLWTLEWVQPVSANETKLVYLTILYVRYAPSSHTAKPSSLTSYASSPVETTGRRSRYTAYSQV